MYAREIALSPGHIFQKEVRVLIPRRWLSPDTNGHRERRRDIAIAKYRYNLAARKGGNPRQNVRTKPEEISRTSRSSISLAIVGADFPVAGHSRYVVPITYVRTYVRL